MATSFELQAVMGATLFGASIVLCGGGYALFLAISRLAGLSKKRTMLNAVAHVWYFLLVISVLGLAILLNLSGWWLTLVVLMLGGYFALPRFIWRLTEELHKADSEH